MKEIKINEIEKKIKELNIDNEFDLIVAIGRGGIIPAFMLKNKIDVPIEIIWINFRNDKNEIIHDEPIVLKEIAFDFKEKNILLVDDVSRTGNTFKKAKKILRKAQKIKTFAVNGDADYRLYNGECFKFPWLQ